MIRPKINQTPLHLVTHGLVFENKTIGCQTQEEYCIPSSVSLSHIEIYYRI